MSQTALKDECKGRDMKGYSSLKKDNLIANLGAGSICLSQTSAYRSVLQIKKLMAEKGVVRSETARKQQQEERAVQARIWEAESAKRRQRKEEEERQAGIRRYEEVKSQLSLHTHKSSVHPCALALTSALKFEGNPRSPRASCSANKSPSCSWRGWIERKKDGKGTAWTCERCDYDICHDCYAFATASKAQQQQILVAHDEERKAARRQQQLELEEELGGPYPAHVKEPSLANKGGACSTGFTVWSSQGYPPDRWHSYAGPPETEYDTTYPTAKEATLRASYLFYFKNPWGLEGDEIANGECSTGGRQPSEVVRLEHIAGDSNTWTVAVAKAGAWVG